MILADLLNFESLLPFAIAIGALIAAVITVVDFAYFLSNIYKIPHGGYWSIIIAAIPLTMIIVYLEGQKKLYRELRPLPLDVFLISFRQLYGALNKIGGTALFFAKDSLAIPPYIVHTIFKNNIIYEDNIIVSIVRRPDPDGITGFFKEPLAVRSFIVFPGLNLDRIEKNLPVHRDDLYCDKVFVQFHDIIDYLGEFVKTRFVIENEVLDERISGEA